MFRLAPEAQRRPDWPRPAVALGNFDGVHRGHQALAQAVVEVARQRSGTAVALTFDPHPARLLNPERAPRPLMELPDKAGALESCGIDVVAVLPFTHDVARQLPREFVEQWLVARLRVACVAIGPDFRFGRGRQGDVAQLSALGQEFGFETRVVEPVIEAGEPISSTRVRQALGEGRVELAALLLGRAYSLSGSVRTGQKRGRLLGFPTANLDPPQVIIPAQGVYAGWCQLADGRRCEAVMNVGSRPTFAGRELGIEAHLLDFSGELYGTELRLSFLRRLREERRFPSVDALRAQIAADVAAARLLLADA